MNNRPDQQTILLLGNYRPTLILARKFSQQGYYIISGLEGCDGGAEYSNSVNEIWDHPSIATDQDGFIAAFNEYIKLKNIDLVFPVTEEFVRLFGENNQLDLNKTKLIGVSSELVKKCLDKISMMTLAKECQIPIFPFARVTDHPELIKVANEIGYPLVIRPEKSTIRLGNKKALFLENEAQLLEQIAVWPKGQSALILQQEAYGRRHNIYFSAKDGEFYSYLQSVILKTDAVDGSGLAVEGVTIDPMEDLHKYSSDLVKALNYTGIGLIQFLVDETTGKVNFLELNSRIVGSHAIPEYAGLELGAFQLNLALGNQIENHNIVGRAGIKYVWTSGDIQGTKIAWLNKSISAWGAIGQVFKAIFAAIRADTHMVFSVKDLKPGLMAFKDQFPNFLKLSKTLKQRQ